MIKRTQASVIFIPGIALLGMIVANNAAYGAATPPEATVAVETRLLAIGGSALALLVLTAILLAGRMRRLVVGEDKRYSNSKFQMALWFAMLIVAYTAALWLRWWKGDGVIGGVGIPPYLVALSGASAFTLGAAKGITTSKQATAMESGKPGKEPARDGPRFPHDLLQNDNGDPDFGDFQMIVITLLAVVVYAFQMFQFLAAPLHGQSLPDVDSTLLAAFGLGQGAYLVKKYAGNPGEA